MAEKTENEHMKVNKVTSQELFQSDFYQIKNWDYDFTEDKQASKGYNDCLCVVVVRKGNFLFDLSNQSYDMHSGHIIIDKPEYEYRLRPSSGACSIFNFTDEFYRQMIDDLQLKYAFFFSNPNLLSLLLKSTPESEYLHDQIIKNTNKVGRLEIDNLVVELFMQIVSCITDTTFQEGVNDFLKSFHLSTIEKAKQYIHDQFTTDISLYEIANSCCVSPFHFSRIFKKFTCFSPYQYLQNVRLKHAEMLLRNTSLPVWEICFASGFNSADYFATAFKQKYKISPTQYRKTV